MKEDWKEILRLHNLLKQRYRYRGYYTYKIVKLGIYNIFESMLKYSLEVEA